jgi:hypothetical protein
MGFWDDLMGKPAQPAPQPDDKYSVNRIQALLEQVGIGRLSVNDARLKVSLTQIAWYGMPYLVDNADNGKPNGSQIAKLQKQLESVLAVLAQYIVVQNNPQKYTDQGGAAALLREGAEGITAFATEITTSTSKSASVTSYQIDAGMLAGKQFGTI